MLKLVPRVNDQAPLLSREVGKPRGCGINHVLDAASAFLRGQDKAELAGQLRLRVDAEFDHLIPRQPFSRPPPKRPTRNLLQNLDCMEGYRLVFRGENRSVPA